MTEVFPGPREPGAPRQVPPIAAPAAEVDPLTYCARPQDAVPGNTVALLRDGAEAYPSMLEAVARAKRYVHLETYIFSDDATGRRFAEALAAAAQRGIEVALLFDSLGLWRAHAYLFDWMSAHGVKVLAYRPLLPWRRGWGWSRRDHRKQLTIDGEVGFTGGINISDFWRCVSEGGEGWRDTMVRIDGPAAATLDGLFRDVWQKEAHRQRVDVDLAPPPPSHPAAVGSGTPVWIVGNRERSRRRSIRRAYRHAIARARSYVFIANSYFVPEWALLRSLRAARRRGVRVVLILPGENDMTSVQWASRAAYDRLLTWGIEIFHWWRPVFHAKTAVVDGLWSTVGSYNLDRQSLRFNLEVAAVIPAREVARSVERMFVEDLRSCTPVRLEEWRARPWWWRIPERFFHLFRAWL